MNVFDMKEQELISVIIPVYNVAEYLPRCLETIAAQTYQNLEIILVDDGSTDNSGQICENFANNDNRAIVIHQQNSGLWASRNAGKKIAKGDYLMFIDGDDYIHLDTIRIAYSTINSNGGYDMALFNFKKTDHFDENVEEKAEHELRELTGKDLFEEFCARRYGIVFESQCNKLYRRNLVEDIWLEKYDRSQDVDFNIRVYMKVERAVWILRELYFYVQRSTSLAHQPEAWDIFFECRSRMFYQNYIKLPSDKKEYGPYLLSQLYRKMLNYKIRNFQTDEQIEVFQKCKKYEHDTLKVYWKSRFTPLHEKAIITMLFHTPRLARWLYKATNKL